MFIRTMNKLLKGLLLLKLRIKIHLYLTVIALILEIRDQYDAAIY